jgi:hypothetical protein
VKLGNPAGTVRAVLLNRESRLAFRQNSYIITKMPDRRSVPVFAESRAVRPGAALTFPSVDVTEWCHSVRRW